MVNVLIPTDKYNKNIHILTDTISLGQFTKLHDVCLSYVTKYKIAEYQKCICAFRNGTKSYGVCWLKMTKHDNWAYLKTRIVHVSSYRKLVTSLIILDHAK